MVCNRIVVNFFFICKKPVKTTEFEKAFCNFAQVKKDKFLNKKRYE